MSAGCNSAQTQGARWRRGLPAVLLACVLFSSALAAPGPARRATLPPDPWWQHAAVYEIYPRSFQDSNDDGVGDLNGITQRLPYLHSLGVDAIWIAPFYPSPQVDFGYDISDYRGVDPQYGTLADFDRLVAAARRQGIRVILDMVLNHSSDQHPWFVQAARSRTSAYHDYYVWNDGRRDAAGHPAVPNNWISLFGGSAWQYVDAVSQYYYHKFYRQQPDLNWRNPQVEAAMFDVMRFWLDRGVAGFRLDAITTLFEDPQLRDERPLGGRNAQGDPNLSDLYTNNLPEVHGVMRRMRAMVDGYADQRVLIGETYLQSTADLAAWYGGQQRDELQLPMDTLLGMGERLDAAAFRDRLLEAAQLPGTPLFVFDNHDNRRSWDRYGDGVHDQAIAKLVATLLLTSRSAALLYQGQEIGQRTDTPQRVQDVRDPIGITGWPKEKGRDGERTPMQWDASAQAGFSRNPKTWLPVSADHAQVNVRSESADPRSVLNWYRRLLALRRSNSALRTGRLVMLDAANPLVLSYARVAADGRAVVVALNMSGEAAQARLAGGGSRFDAGRLRGLLDHEPGVRLKADRVTLPPFASWVAATR